MLLNILHKTTPTMKNYSHQTVSSAEVEKPWNKAITENCRDKSWRRVLTVAAQLPYLAVLNSACFNYTNRLISSLPSHFPT